MSNPLFDQLRDELPVDDVPEAPVEFTHPDGSTYLRIDPDLLPNCDWVDSTIVRDYGAPA